VTGLALLALLVGVLAACGGQTPVPTDPKVTAEAFLKAMGERKDADAYKLLSADTQATVSEDDFKKMLDDAWTSAGISGFQVKTVQEAVLSKSGSRASVPYQATLTTAQGGTDVFNALSLVLQNGQWRVIWPPAR
jgi:hypothetical protein